MKARWPRERPVFEVLTESGDTPQCAAGTIVEGIPDRRIKVGRLGLATIPDCYLVVRLPIGKCKQGSTSKYLGYEAYPQLISTLRPLTKAARDMLATVERCVVHGGL